MLQWKNICLLTLLPVITMQVPAQTRLDFLSEYDHLFFEDLKYDRYDACTYDIILPASEKPTPLVIFYHGGGFVGGDKRVGMKRQEDIEILIKHNIAFATVNYRFRKADDSLGVKRCLGDSKRFLQYIRHHAGDFNIDKERIGIFGGSAGAGTSLYLAFHDDMAIPGDTSLKGESTRVNCVGALGTQATYDIFRWKEFVPCLRLVFFLKRRSQYQRISNFYGYPSYKALKPHKEEITSSLDMLRMIDSADPPTYIMNPRDEWFPWNRGIINHHQKHALKVKEVLEKKGIPHYVYTHKNIQEAADYPVSRFFVKHLK